MPLLVQLPWRRDDDRVARFDYVPARLSGADYQMPDRFFLVYRPEQNEPGWTMTFQVVDGVPHCRSIAIEATEEGREVRSGDVRSIHVEEFLELAATNVALRHDGEQLERDLADLRSGFTLKSVKRSRRAARRKVTDHELRRVAEVYRENINDRPTAAVGRYLGVQERAARLWVRRARDAGFLGKAIHGRAGER